MKLIGYHQLVVWAPLLLTLCHTVVIALEQRQTYIIHVDPAYKPSLFPTHESWHRQMLSRLSSPSPSPETAPNEEKLLYSYSHVMHGFSARLTPSELAELQKLPAHRVTYRERYGKLFTTHTPRYLGLNHKSGLWPASSYGNDVIIGVIDTGVWPESQSFHDKGMPPIPERWKGECENGTNFSPSLCNRKLIGARSFSKGLKAGGINISTEYDYDSPRDFMGHGTHTTSTAGGSYVPNADYFGYAEGMAKGLAPAARVAMYKVLWASDTDQSAATDVLAGMDQAIADGVDVMSLSLGFDHTPYYEDVIAIGALSAVEKGIVVVCAAGNDGAHNTTYNGAPWIMTVGAGTIDRSFVGQVTLGGNVTVEGTSYYPESLYISNAPFYYGGDDIKRATCQAPYLNALQADGKVVLCDGTNETDIFSQIHDLQGAGAKAGIFLANGMFLDPEDYSFPILVIPAGKGADSLRKFANEVDNATVTEMRFRTTKLGAKPAPQVAYFSSRGPDPISPSVLKPDILAPGEDVLAAYIPTLPFMDWGSDSLTTDYALMSGTSMATPHVAGVSALLRAVHKDWSPAAIRSAIMTSARAVDNTGGYISDQWNGLPATPLDFGAGHVNPNDALDPGLVYDMEFDDYVQFICGLGYNQTQMAAVIRRGEWSCQTNSSGLNYPSFMAAFSPGTSNPMTKNFSRIVTNVGGENVTYRAVVKAPKGMRIQVEPETLTFSSKYQKLGFMVSIVVEEEVWAKSTVAYGFLRWIDQFNHIVSSPVVAISL